MKARDQGVTKALQEQVLEMTKLGWYHSIQLPTGEVIPGLQSLETLRERLARFPLPKDLKGKRVLDIGAWDGWFTFEMERRGASVVAVDLTANTKFLKAKELMGSQADYHTIDVMELSPASLGLFDIVIFLGVLYHLKHPLLALEKVCAMSTDVVLVESYVSDTHIPDAVPRMEFYEYGELCGQLDNWVGPNTACLLAWCRTAGFARAVLTTVIDNRAHVMCHRKWELPVGPLSAAPYIIAVRNALSLDHSFSSVRDEYLSLAFESAETGLTVNDVYPEVCSYGSPPLSVTAFGVGGWLVNFKLPPGLKSGWHQVALRVRNSETSNALRIGIDHPEPGNEERNERLRIVVVADNATWERNAVRLGQNSAIAVWIQGLSGPQRRTDVELRLSGTSLPALFVSEPDAEGLVQINAALPPGLAPGKRELQVVSKRIASAAVELSIV